MSNSNKQHTVTGDGKSVQIQLNEQLAKLKTFRRSISDYLGSDEAGMVAAGQHAQHMHVLLEV
ncbi:MAG: hypothetical protein IPJ88_09145 [Myxococcales bacterium]|nr:MAG: hypothetical protein IPJ88_09145 [Myxococcales bacterium]